MDRNPSPEKSADRPSPSKDVLASVVVFLVALPLCMGIAIASGADPAMGLLSGIVGGIVVGAISGAPLQVTGPAAGLAVICFELIQKHGLPAFALIIVAAGCIQIVAASLRLGVWFRAISPAVVQGMLSGIGVVIFASQFHIMVDDKPQARAIDNLISIPSAVVKGLTPVQGSSHHLAAILGLITVGAIVLWKLYAPRRIKFLPAPLVGVALATATAAFMGWKVDQVVVRPLAQAIQLPGLALQMPWWEFALASVGLAFIASAETLLSAAAIDSMHGNPRLRTRYNRELFAQGVGNTLCGLIGGLPVTGVIVRSAANVEAGATSRWSAVMHGGWLLLFVVFLPQALSWIPVSCLAAVLVYTGFKLASPEGISRLKAYGHGQVAICLATMVAITLVNLLFGVIFGFALATAHLLWRRSALNIEVHDEGGKRFIRIDGAATFLNLPKLAGALERAPMGSELHLDISGLDFVDHASLELIKNWGKQYVETGGTVTIDWDVLHGKLHRGQAVQKSSAA
jgi:MFS superfamily sulfate permease-like transporter